MPLAPPIPSLSSASRRRAMGWIGLGLLGFVLLTGAFASLRLPDLPGAPSTTALAVGQMIICTGSGLRIIDITAEGGTASPDPAQQPSNPLCLLCLPLAPGAAALAVLAVSALLVAAERLPRTLLAPASSNRPCAPLCCGSTRVTRGPPATGGHPGRPRLSPH